MHGWDKSKTIQEIWKNNLTDVKASPTLVKRAGRKECIRIFCSVSIQYNSTKEFSGPRHLNNEVNEAPLKKKIEKKSYTAKKDQQRFAKEKFAQ